MNIKNAPRVYFYIPPEIWPDYIPDTPSENWKGFGLGRLTWTVQTFLQIKNKIECELTNVIPNEGIIFFHRNTIRDNFKPSKKQILVCIKADSTSGKHQYSQLHIVQNPHEENIDKNDFYISHWPQPGLIRRNSSRRNSFSRLAYFGHEVNLAKELKSPRWKDHLKDLELDWHCISNNNHWESYQDIDNSWNDYSEIDAIIAVRSFNKTEIEEKDFYSNKPATKLINAWLSNVPAILGVERAYQMVGTAGDNYVEVDSFESLLKTLEEFKKNPDIPRQISENGVNKSVFYTPEHISQSWCSFIEDIAIPKYNERQKMSLAKYFWTDLRTLV